MEQILSIHIFDKNTYFLVFFNTLKEKIITKRNFSKKIIKNAE